MKDNTNKVSVDEVMNSFSNTFSKIFNNYKYSGISKDEYLNIIQTIISLSKDSFDNTSNYEEYIKIEVEKEVTNVIGASLYDDEKAFEVLNNYINQELGYASDYETALKNIHIFVKFLEKYEYNVPSTILSRLIKENSKFSNCVNAYVKEKIDVIQSNGISVMSKNKNIQAMVKEYCIQHDIEIVDKEDEEFYFDDAYKAFIHQINQIPILTSEEQRDLLYKAKNGSKAARDKLVNANMRFVVSVAKNFVNSKIPILDLVQEGSIGLIDAIESFDMSRNNKFLTYACYHIKKRIMRSIYNNSRNIRLPWHVHEDLNKYKNAVNELMEKIKRTPTIEEVADYMNLPIDKIKEFMLLQDDTVSINFLISEDTELEKFIVDKSSSIEDDYISVSITEEIREIIDSGMFDERERQIIKLRFGFEDGKPWRLREIGEKFGLSRERVRQIEAKLLRRLKYSLKCRNLVEYADNPDKAISEIRKAAIKNCKEKNDINTIYENFDGYTHDQINDVIFKLSSGDIKLIKKKYGDRFLDTAVVKPLSKIDSFLFYNSLIPRIKKDLANLYDNNNKEGIQK